MYIRCTPDYVQRIDWTEYFQIFILINSEWVILLGDSKKKMVSTFWVILQANPGPFAYIIYLILNFQSMEMFLGAGKLKIILAI